MKWNLMATGLALALTAGVMSSAANAAGCLKGAAVGGVAGHHGVLGAGAGCVIGHHEASKHARQQATQNQGSGSSATSKYGQSEPAR
jgi:hypothetical protein